MDKGKIFISHSSQDKEIVTSFVDNILKLGLGISSKRIFCSSISGSDIECGGHIPDVLRAEIHKSSLVLLFISENYKKSEVCHNEVGAACVTLPEKSVIPLLMPGVEYKSLGLLNLNKLAIRLDDRDGLYKLFDDSLRQFNPECFVSTLYEKIDVFLSGFKDNVKPDKLMDADVDQSNFLSYVKIFNSFDDIIRKTIPAYSDGIHRISNSDLQNRIIDGLSKINCLVKILYRNAAAGDEYINQIKQLPGGNWLISKMNWEVNILEMWVCINREMQNEFILFKSAKQKPFTIQSDVGGTDYLVGILSDGTIVSNNERENGYANINGKIIDLSEMSIEPRLRYKESQWTFLISDYHKLGYNGRETMEFCKKLDKGEIEVNAENIASFLQELENDPDVLRNR